MGTVSVYHVLVFHFGPDTHPNFNRGQIKFDLRKKQVLTPWTKVRVFQTYFLSSVFHLGITAKSAFLIFTEKQIFMSNLVKFFLYQSKFF